MEIADSITFVGEDKDWISKLLLGAVIANIPILNLTWLGYLTDLMKNVSDGDEFPLPEWDNLGEKFIRGLVLLLAAAVYSLPGLLLFGIPMLSTILANTASGESLQDAAATGLAAGSVFLACLLSVYFLVVLFIFPAVNLNFAQKGTFRSCFELGTIFRMIFSNLGNYLLAFLVLWAASILIGIVAAVLNFLLAILICIGWLLIVILGAMLNVWLGTVYAHLFGQVGYESLAETAS